MYATHTAVESFFLFLPHPPHTPAFLSFTFQQNLLYIIYKHGQLDLGFDPVGAVYRLFGIKQKTKNLSSLR